MIDKYSIQSRQLHMMSREFAYTYRGIEDAISGLLLGSDSMKWQWSRVVWVKVRIADFMKRNIKMVPSTNFDKLGLLLRWYSVVPDLIYRLHHQMVSRLCLQSPSANKIATLYRVFSWWVNLYRMFNLKVNRILIWVIYLLRFTTRFITQLNCI